MSLHKSSVLGLHRSVWIIPTYKYQHKMSETMTLFQGCFYLLCYTGGGGGGGGDTHYPSNHYKAPSLPVLSCSTPTCDLRSQGPHSCLPGTVIISSRWIIRAHPLCTSPTHRQNKPSGTQTSHSSSHILSQDSKGGREMRQKTLQQLKNTCSEAKRGRDKFF